MSYLMNWLKGNNVIIVLLIFILIVVIVREISDLAHFGINTWIDVSCVVTTIGIIIGVLYYISSIRWNFYRYLADLYYEMLKIGLENPEFCDPENARNYEKWSSDYKKHKYDIFAKMCWAYLEDIYDTSLKMKWLLSKTAFIKLYAPTFEQIKKTHGAWLENNKSTFPMTGFLEFIEFNKWRVDLDPSTSEILRWNYAAYDYDEKFISPLKVKQKNHLLKCIDGIRGQKLIVADVGCGNGSFIANHLASNHWFDKIYGIDFSDDMIKIATEKCKKFSNVTFHKINIKNLYSGLKQDKPNIIFSINSILPFNPKDTDIMFCEIALTLKPGGKFIAVLPSFDAVEHLKNLEFENFKAKRAKCSKNILRKGKKISIMYGFYDFCKLYIKFYFKMKNGTLKMIYDNRKDYMAVLDTWKLFYHERMMNDNEKLYADDGVNVQRFTDKNEIKQQLKKVGLNLINGYPIKLFYPGEMSEEFGYGFHSKEDMIWDWFLVAEKPE